MSASPICGILQNTSMVDYPDHLAVVLFTGGCNFRCGFCHNAHLLDHPPPPLPWTDVEAACRRFRENWADAAVLTGGEPTLKPRLFHTVEKLKQWGFRVKLDTNGSRPDVLEELLPLLDYVAMDIKCSPAQYAARTGFADTPALERSIRLIRDRAADYEFRTTLLEAWHPADEVQAMGEWVRGAKRYILQAFVPRDDLPDAACRTLPETSAAHLHAMAALLRPYADAVEIRGGF